MFRFILLATICARIHAQIITPINPVVKAGQTQRFTADRKVTWSLLAGSVGFIEGDGTYHAPASIAVPKSLAGCQIGPADSIFNTRIDNLPLHPSNTVWMAALPALGITLDPSWGVNVVDDTTPGRLFKFNYTPTYNDLPFQMPAWPALKRESGVFSDPLVDNDRHVLTINRKTCQVYEIYNNYPAGTMGSIPPASTFTAQSGWQYNSMSYSLPTGGATDAAGLPLAPTTLNLDDIRSGTIRHALRVTFANAYIAPASIWPATSHAGAWGVVPYGARLRLKSAFETSGFSPVARVILTALKDYGMIISDGGANWDIIAATDITEDRVVQAAIREIEHANAVLNRSQFEIVDESSLMVSPSLSQVAYGNKYETPQLFALVKADDGVHPAVAMRIALQGVALNSPDGGGLWIQSGVEKTLAVFAGGAANPSVTWKMNPPLGVLNPTSGVYLPPVVKAPSTTSITATSVADPTVSVTFPVTVVPSGPIRIVSGDATANPAAPRSHAPDYGPDSMGNMWWRDQAVERGGGVRNDYYYPVSNWPKITDSSLYQTQYYNYGDTVYRFVVQNGRYKIDYYAAQGDEPSCNTKGVAGIAEPRAYRAHLESQGQITAHDFSPLSATGGKCYLPGHTTIPALVTDNNLYFAIRHLSDHTQTGASQSPHTIIGAFSITPVDDMPHLTIDPPNPPALTVSETLQLYAVGWYMSPDVTWAIVSGPGSIAADGLYKAPAMPVNGKVTVRATSKTDPAQSATVNMSLSMGAVTVTPDSITLNRSATAQMTAKIGNQTYTDVIWTLTPAVGIVTAAGIYTAPDALAQDTTITVAARSATNPNLAGVAHIVIRANPDPIRVKCGAGAFTDAQGNIWAADYGFSEPSLSYGKNVAIGAAPPGQEPLYQSARYSGYENHAFSYRFPLPNGHYRVNLKFADYEGTARGHWRFTVKMNGATMLNNFDPVSAVGAFTAIDKTFSVTVINNVLKIDFDGGLDYAIVNAIEIIPIL